MSDKYIKNLYPINELTRGLDSVINDVTRSAEIAAEAYSDFTNTELTALSIIGTLPMEISSKLTFEEVEFDSYYDLFCCVTDIINELSKHTSTQKREELISRQIAKSIISFTAFNYFSTLLMAYQDEVYNHSNADETQFDDALQLINQIGHKYGVLPSRTLKAKLNRREFEMLLYDLNPNSKRGRTLFSEVASFLETDELELMQDFTKTSFMQLHYLYIEAMARASTQTFNELQDLGSLEILSSVMSVVKFVTLYYRLQAINSCMSDFPDPFFKLFDLYEREDVRNYSTFIDSVSGSFFETALRIHSMEIIGTILGNKGYHRYRKLFTRFLDDLSSWLDRSVAPENVDESRLRFWNATIQFLHKENIDRESALSFINTIRQTVPKIYQADLDRAIFLRSLALINNDILSVEDLPSNLNIAIELIEKRLSNFPQLLQIYEMKIQESIKKKKPIDKIHCLASRINKLNTESVEHLTIEGDESSLLDPRLRTVHNILHDVIYSLSEQDLLTLISQEALAMDHSRFDLIISSISNDVERVYPPRLLSFDVLNSKTKMRSADNLYDYLAILMVRRFNGERQRGELRTIYRRIARVNPQLAIRIKDLSNEVQIKTSGW